MASRFIECLECGREFFETLSECPDCGNSDLEKMARAESVFGDFGLKVPGAQEQSDGDAAMDRKHQLHLEKNKDKVQSGEWEAKLPKNRNKRFDPSWVSEKRLF